MEQKKRLLGLCLLLLFVNQTLATAPLHKSIALLNREALVLEAAPKDMSREMEIFGRKDLESNDYPDPGPNPGHKPPPPGTSVKP